MYENHALSLSRFMHMGTDPSNFEGGVYFIKLFCTLLQWDPEAGGGREGGHNHESMTLPACPGMVLCLALFSLPGDGGGAGAGCSSHHTLLGRSDAGVNGSLEGDGGGLVVAFNRVSSCAIDEKKNCKLTWSLLFET